MTDTEFDYHNGFYTLNAESKPEDCRKLYENAKDSYEKIAFENMKYIAPMITAEFLVKHLEQLGFSQDVRILDLGCGTGMVGEELNRRGYKNIDGVDICGALVDKAKEKGLYTKLTVGEMASEDSKKLNVAADQYGAAACAGVFTLGHVKGKGFDDFLHILKSGGIACFTVRKMAWDDKVYGFVEKMEKLCEMKKWKIVEKKFVDNYTAEDGCWLFCCQKL